MTSKYSFEQKEIDGQEYVIARRGQGADPIRVRADWTQEDDLEGNWEPLIETIVQPETITEIDIENGVGGISRTEAIESLTESTVNDKTIVATEEQADALIEYLSEEDVIDIQGNRLVLFKNPNEEDLSSTWFVNWAALMGAVIEEIDSKLQEIESAQEKFKNTLDNLEPETDSKTEQHLSELRQRLQNLGPGQGIPKPEELTDEEKQTYKRLKRNYLKIREIKEAKEQDFFENIEQGTEKIEMAVRRLDAQKEGYEQMRKDVRRMAFKKDVFPDEALNFVDSAGELLKKMNDVDTQTANEIDDAEFREMIEDDMDSDIQQTGEQTEEFAEKTEEALGPEYQQSVN